MIEETKLHFKNILSLFDGMSVGQLALKKAGITYDNYFASEIDKHAIKVTQHNFPNTVQLGSVTKVLGKDLPPIDLILAGSPCFTAGNLVMTSEGYIPIEEIQVGDMVLTHNNRFRKVLRIGGDRKETIIIKSQGATQIETTKNHPFYCYEDRKESPLFVWKKIIDFKPEDKVVSLKWGKTKDLPEFTDMDLYILGRFVADGCCWKTKRKNRKNSYSYTFKISIGKHEIEDFKSKVDDRFSIREDRTAYNAFISKQEWVEIGQKFGHLAHNKFIPNFILDLPVERLKIFLNGYMDGDGYVKKGKHSEVNTYKKNTTVSEKLALTLSLAIQKCYNGVSIAFTKKNPVTIIENRLVNQKDLYEVSYTETKTKFSKFKTINDFTVYNLTKRTSFIDNGIQDVYNIEVEEDNSYVVNNLVVHNCQGFSFAGQQLNFSDPRSKLFFDFVRLLEECKPKHFLLENVVMQKQFEVVISKLLGVEPEKIDSALVSAQTRKRLYWANFPIVQPKDRNIQLKDILEYDGNEYNPAALRGVMNKKPKFIVSNILNEDKNLEDIITNTTLSSLPKPKSYVTHLVVRPIQKAYCLTTVDMSSVLTTMPPGSHPDVFGRKLPYRKYTLKELCRLQTVPDNYFDGVASLNQAKKMLGNGWNVDTIVHILDGLK